MADELWMWWMKSLFFTGVVTIVVFCGIAELIDKLKPDSKLVPISTLIGVLPWVIDILSVVVWLLVLIWRR